MSAITEGSFKIVGSLLLSNEDVKRYLIPEAHLKLRLYMPHTGDKLPDNLTQQVPIAYKKSLIKYDRDEETVLPKDSLPKFYVIGKLAVEQPISYQTDELSPTVKKCDLARKMTFCYVDNGLVDFYQGLCVKVVPRFEEGKN